jgi:glutaredoxin
MAKSLLKSQGWAIEETPRTAVSDSEWHWKTVPQIWLNGKHIGGYTELVNHLGQGEKTYSECAACEG